MIDRKDFRDHLVDAMAVAKGRRESWAGRNHLIVKVEQLKKTGSQAGVYQLLDCTCGGGAECTGVDSEIEVSHTSDIIEWKCGVPEVWVDGKAQFLHFKFHKPQYLKELEQIG